MTASASDRLADTSCAFPPRRSEEHTSELQSQSNLVCRLLLEKKNNRSHHKQCPPSNSYQKRPDQETNTPLSRRRRITAVNSCTFRGSSSSAIRAPRHSIHRIA